MWPSMIVGALLGLLFVPLADWLSHIARNSYDTGHPVVVGRADILKRGIATDDVQVLLSGEKLRDCDYIGISAYSVSPDDELHSVYMLRADQPSTGATRPVGRHSFGVWRLWPIIGTDRIVIWATHTCSGRIVRSKFAEVKL